MTKQSFRVVHVHTDLKFIYETDRFDEARFDNEVVIVSNVKVYHGPHCDRIKLFSYEKNDFRQVVRICNNADIVILYALDHIKSHIALSLSEDVFIAWRFFGYELYKRKVELYLSEHSLLYRNKKSGLLRKGKDSLRQSRFWLQYGSTQDAFFAKAIRRTNAFLGLSLYEYEHLVDSWGSLPLFIQLAMLSPENFGVEEQDRNDIISAKEDIVIIGNNRSIYNNHLDILILIEESRCDSQISFLLPFSYGRETPYTNAVRHHALQSSKDFHLLENFMQREAYFALIAKAKAAVFNGYRQMAMGNIFVLLAAGIKVYLNTQNVIYHWFVDLGLKVFTIEDFKLDLESNNLELDMADKLINVHRLEQLETDLGQDKFINDILAILSAKDGKI